MRHVFCFVNCWTNSEAFHIFFNFFDLSFVSFVLCGWWEVGIELVKALLFDSMIVLYNNPIIILQQIIIYFFPSNYKLFPDFLKVTILD